ncbi:MAG: V-type ATP synthase subunit D [Candidatus Omnitrophota bacterium]
MEKLKHTKNELKKQKDALRRFMRYLPTLLLKKQQLQLEILKIANAIEKLEEEAAAYRESVYEWVDVFSEGVSIKEFILVDKVNTATGNIAGTDIPIFESIDFIEKEYDLIKTPLWVDYGISAAKEMIAFKVKEGILKKQIALIREELRVTAQRVNLFEKVKIPESKENIRIINIFLGDAQTAAVVTGKIAKKKIEQKYAVAV